MLFRPVHYFAARSPHTVEVVDLSAALHAAPGTLGERIQEQVDATGPGVDAVVLAYGLCGGATAGLTARSVPVVLPRAHDCVTIFLGDRARYQREHEATPGTYWYVQDQMERGNALKGWLLGDAARSEDVVATRAEYAARFGEANADYLMETLGTWSARYERGVLLDTGLVSGDAAAAQARAESDRRGWRFERVAADLGLVRRLLFGQWDDDFQVLQPGERLEMSYDEAVVRAVGAPSHSSSAGAAAPPAAREAPGSRHYRRAPSVACDSSRPERNAPMNSKPKASTPSSRSAARR
jgi:hypothetical protein